jgi:hypothetical protein
MRTLCGRTRQRGADDRGVLPCRDTNDVTFHVPVVTIPSTRRLHINLAAAALWWHHFSPPTSPSSPPWQNPGKTTLFSRLVKIVFLFSQKSLLNQFIHRHSTCSCICCSSAPTYPPSSSPATSTSKARKHILLPPHGPSSSGSCVP